MSYVFDVVVLGYRVECCFWMWLFWGNYVFGGLGKGFSV